MRTLAVVAALAALFTACTEEAPKVEKQKEVDNDTVNVYSHPEWAKNANIYEVNIRQYTAEGTFAAFEKHLPRLKEMGVDILSIMPIQPIGMLNRKGGKGSYYSIRDYETVNPDFGTQEDFTKLVENAHALGLKVILNWVANHTAFDHTWITNRPDFYTKDDVGFSPIVALDNAGNSTDWTDVADLDYANDDLNGAMTESMRYWVNASNIDGFYCDKAALVPVDFWEYAFAKLRLTKPDLFFVAECEDPHYLDVDKFDMGYAWSLYHLMNKVAKGDTSPIVFKSYLKTLESEFRNDDLQLMFTTNHEENARHGTALERLGNNSTNMFVLATTFQNGMPLIYGGQEAGLDKRLRFFEKDTISWKNTELIPFYTKMLALKHNNMALWNGLAGGKMKPIETGHPDEIYAFYREKDGNRVIVLLNFSARSIQFKPQLDGIYGSYKIVEGVNVDWSTNPNLTLEPYQNLIVTKQN